jgi:predicted Zn-dependent protease
MRLFVDALVRTNHTDQAISFLQKVLSSSPENAQAHALLGAIRLANNSPEEARQEFSRAVEAAPTDSIGYRGLASLYLRTKDLKAASAVIRTGLARNPQSPALHMSLAEIAESAGDYEGAISEYEHVIEEDPGSTIAANNLASLLADHRSDRESLAKAQSLAARLRQSDVPQFKDTLGWVSYRGGDVNTAVSLLKEAAAALPNQPLVHYHLAMGYVAIGQRDRASNELAAALAKGPDTDLKNRIDKELAKLTTQ